MVKRILPQRSNGLHGNFVHGASISRPPEYRAYCNARERCNNSNHHAYKNYGGRGIRFCFNSFGEFLSEIGTRPSACQSLNRIENDGHYEPGNVEWADRTKQSNNRRNLRLLTCKNETLSESEWAKRLGCGPSVIDMRLRAGWCVTCAVTKYQKGRHFRCEH